ncbi:MAG TPA: LLM class flavin-dependent oxidoreductase [Devosia sp.]|nr:LLM class flavin-dependent oxidoreductase [Devosia sp.]
MAKRLEKMNLGVLLLISGSHYAGWRHPSSEPEKGAKFEHYADLARIAERGKMDFLFLADSMAAYEGTAEQQVRHKNALMHNEPKRLLEPLTLLSALSVITSNIGLVSTATTTYNEPYPIARMFASLDHISNGRAGWNVVTSANLAEAHNFGRDAHVAHAERYERANEFLDVVMDLWDSIDSDALVIDKETGVYFNGDKFHFIDHVGKHFKIKGPLNVPRPPQGYPVIVQAGSSGPGIDLAARSAEVVFTAQQVMSDSVLFYKTLKGRMEAYGREQSTLKVMPGIVPYVGESEQEARDKFEELGTLLHPEFGLYILSDLLGEVDLSAYPLDGPLPEISIESNASKSRQAVMIEMARRENLTIRQLYQRAAVSGHNVVCGTPAQIADMMEEWFQNGAADGFNILPPFLPDGLAQFVDKVIPELQRRGLFRTEYEATTLRGNLGLAKPANRLQARLAAEAAE